MQVFPSVATSQGPAVDQRPQPFGAEERADAPDGHCAVHTDAAQPGGHSGELKGALAPSSPGTPCNISTNRSFPTKTTTTTQKQPSSNPYVTAIPTSTYNPYFVPTGHYVPVQSPLSQTVVQQQPPPQPQSAQPVAPHQQQHKYLCTDRPEVSFRCLWMFKFIH